MARPKIRLSVDDAHIGSTGGLRSTRGLRLGLRADGRHERPRNLSAHSSQAAILNTGAPTMFIIGMDVRGVNESSNCKRS